VSAGCCNLLECFFDSVGHQPSRGHRQGRVR
jgi:hypothetical protein